jgi:hypothetical protein
MTKFNYEDLVRVRSDAPQKFRPDERARVVGVITEDKQRLRRIGACEKQGMEIELVIGPFDYRRWCLAGLQRRQFCTMLWRSRALPRAHVRSRRSLLKRTFLKRPEVRVPEGLAGSIPIVLKIRGNGPVERRDR